MNNQQPPQHPCEESFSIDHYVQRGELEDALRQWLQDPLADNEPILSLVGPPGSGKSWLLAYIRQMLEDEYPFVLFLAARQLMDLNQHYQIKGELIQKANSACTALNYHYDLLPTLSALVADITQRLCTRCAGQRFLVLIDDCDDLASQNEFDTLQRDYLRPFFDAKARCFRMIIARRLELAYPLKKLSQPLSVGVFANDAETDAHRRKLSRQLQNIGAPWPALPAGCNYRWNHPYINCYLVHGFQGGGITAGTLASCCRAVIERSIPGNPARHQATVDADLRKLTLITQEHAGRWTSDDFRDRIGEDLDDAYVRRGLITVRIADDELSGPTYRVIDGLHELLAALPEEELRS